MSVRVRHPLLCLFLFGCFLATGCARRASDGDGSGSDTTPSGDQSTELDVQLPSDSGPVLAPADNAPAPIKETEGNEEDKVIAEDIETTENADKPAQPTAPVASAASPDAAPRGEPIEVVLGDPQLLNGIPGEGPLDNAQIQAWLDDPKNHAPLKVTLPMGLAAAAANITGLDENPMTFAKLELGRQLYFDARLSSDNTISCASCHHPDEAFGRHTQFGVGVDDQTGNRNSPISYNRILSGAQFWDGRAASLEEQAVGPIANPIEMGNTHEACVATLSGIEGYRMQFAKVFPGEEITVEQVGQAIAAFERAIVTTVTPYDHFEFMRSFGDEMDEEDIEELKEEDPELYARYEAAVEGAKPMSESARRGRDLFFSEKSNCTACHAGANFTDELYHNLGVGMDVEQPDLGRYEVTKADKDRGAFKTPTLRNVALSAPYMHDGSQETLEEVIEWYVQGGHPNPHLSDKVTKLELSDQEKQDLLAFMNEGLTSSFSPMETERLPE